MVFASGFQCSCSNVDACGVFFHTWISAVWHFTHASLPSTRLGSGGLAGSKICPLFSTGIAFALRMPKIAAGRTENAVNQRDAVFMLSGLSLGRLSPEKSENSDQDATSQWASSSEEVRSRFGTSTCGSGKLSKSCKKKSRLPMEAGQLTGKPLEQQFGC